MKLQKIIFLTLIIFVVFRYFSSLPSYKNGDRLKITTTVLNEPIQYDKYQYLKIKGLKVYLPKYPEINYGDKLEIIGRVEDNYLKDVSFKVLDKEVGLLSNFRNNLIYFYKSSLPEPYSSLVAGITLGSKNMPEAFWEKLKLTGTAHMVVASGTNITLLTSFLILASTSIIKRKYAVFIALTGIIFYLFLTDFDAPVVRASIMASIVFLAQLKGKVVDSFKLLVFSGLIMLIFKPEWINDLGFLLSFAATASIIIFGKRIDEHIKRVPNVLRESISTSISAQIGVIPILFITFGQFNLLSIIINPLVLWVVPIIMVFGGVSAVLSLFVPEFSRLILFVLFPVLYYFEAILNIFS